MVDELDALFTPNCPRCLNAMEPESDDVSGAHARWRCPTCGHVAISV